MDEHKLNGDKAAPAAENPATQSGLAEAIQRHAATMVKAVTNPQGLMAINPAQLYCDSELHAVRLEVLFESLVKAGVVDPAELTMRLRDKLNAESDQLEELQKEPQIQLVTGRVPRND
jgi:hypothetical protein